MLVAIACGDSSGDVTTTTAAASSTTTTTTTTAPPSSIAEGASGLTGLDADLADLRIANGGSLPADAALDLFAAVFGPVPGADETRFASRSTDGTMAARNVLAHWDGFTPDQQQRIAAYLGFPGVKTFRAAAQTEDPALQAVVDPLRAAIAARVGADLPYPIVALRMELGSRDGRRIAGMTLPLRGGEVALSGTPDECVVVFPPEDTPTATTVAHEVFHCFQFHLAPSLGAVYGGEDWIVEGSAEWAGAEIGGIDEGIEGHFGGWLANSGSVFGLDYTAVGLYWVIESMGVDPAPAIGAMLGSSGAGAIAALGLDPAAVLNRVASSPVRRDSAPGIPQIGGSWDFSDPQVPAGGIRVPRVVDEGTAFTFESGSGGYAKGDPILVELVGGTRVQVLADADVGTLQFYDKDAIAWSGSLSREFCLEPGGCRCGVDGAVDPGLEEGTRDLAIAGGEAGGGPITYTVRIPRSDGGFTDGTWSGQFSASYLLLSGDGVVGRRESGTFPAEFVIENGAVTSGSYTLEFSAEMHSADAHGFGTATISGIFTGCGFAPQMQGTSFSFTGVAIIDGTAVPLEFGFPMSPVSGVTTTFWVPDPVTDPDRRTGSIDTGGYLAAISSSGIAASGLEITFQLGRTG